MFEQLTYALGSASLIGSMNEGMDALTLQRAANLAFGWLSATYDVTLQAELPFCGRRFRTVAGYLRALRPLMGAPDTAVVIAFRAQRKGHWTVVRDATGPDLLLRDSGGLSCSGRQGSRSERGGGSSGQRTR